MKINRLKVLNFRTLEDIDFTFPSFYTAICGKNDSGKTNVVKAIRSLIRENDPYVYVPETEFSLKDNFPKWKNVDPKDRKTAISLEITIDSSKEPHRKRMGLFQ